MKILVTGANGYIGSRVVTNLINHGAEVVATDMADSHIDKRAKVILADIFKDNDNWFGFFGEPDVCLHLAWRDGFVHNSTKNIEDLSSHFNFLKNLLDNGLKQVVSMGSMHEIGYCEGMISEHTECHPSSLYGVAKCALRESLKIYSEKSNAVFQWLRGYYLYGDDAFGNSIFCKLRQAVNEGKRTFPFTSGKNKYDFIPIDLFAEYVSRCVMQSEVNGIIDICSGTPVALGQMIEEYIQANSLPIKLDYGKYPDRPYDSPCVYGDRTKLNKIIGE
ncbi:MAG: NAD(P)-dependent oxidoreductase [Bacilli bacterium]|nr:NAD(P)-dependent oxidoreductase [Bacilli bacterium]